jgi:hypothetical protein
LVHLNEYLWSSFCRVVAVGIQSTGGHDEVSSRRASGRFTGSFHCVSNDANDDIRRSWHCE